MLFKDAVLFVYTDSTLEMRGDAEAVKSDAEKTYIYDVRVLGTLNDMLPVSSCDCPEQLLRALRKRRRLSQKQWCFYTNETGERSHGPTCSTLGRVRDLQWSANIRLSLVVVADLCQYCRVSGTPMGTFCRRSNAAGRFQATNRNGPSVSVESAIETGRSKVSYAYDQ